MPLLLSRLFYCTLPLSQDVVALVPRICRWELVAFDSGRFRARLADLRHAKRARRSSLQGCLSHENVFDGPMEDPRRNSRRRQFSEFTNVAVARRVVPAIAYTHVLQEGVKASSRDSEHQACSVERTCANAKMDRWRMPSSLPSSWRVGTKDLDSSYDTREWGEIDSEEMGWQPTKKIHLDLMAASRLGLKTASRIRSRETLVDKFVHGCIETRPQKGKAEPELSMRLSTAKRT